MPDPTTIEWHHRDEWVANQYSNICRVIVSRHLKHDGNGWCVYALIYPDHPLFAPLLAAHQADRQSYEVPEIDAMPLHCGCTHWSTLSADGRSISGFKIGADYSHLHDDHYLRYATKDQAASVFHDAADLLAYLQGMEKPV